MSIYLDFDVGPAGRRFRRAVGQDQLDIEAIWRRDLTEDLFYDVDIGALIELSTLAICMIDTQNKVTGFLALCDYPNTVGVHPAHWEAWLANLFQKHYLPRNTLFIHFACWAPPVAGYFLLDALTSAFLNDAYLMQIVLLVPPSCGVDLSRYTTFKGRSLTRVAAAGDDRYHMQVATRKEFCPPLKVRRAVEEDNDDIVQILDRQCPRFKDLYGQYYVSEIVGHRPPSKRQILVAQSQERAVGVMCVNAELNYAQLQSTYELSPYHGLRRATPLEKELYRRRNALLKQFGDPTMLGQRSPFNLLTKPHVAPVDDDELSKESLKKPSCTKRSKVNFHVKKPLRITSSKNPSEGSYKSASPVSLTADFGYNVGLLLDEEPLDYDIVNIDSSLLHSSIPSCDFSPTYEGTSAQRKQTNRSREQQFSSRKRKSTINVDESAPIYSGPPNAFVIEMYGLREDIDERRSYDLLQAAFECMASYDYCVIRVPTTEKSFPLLQHFTFVPLRANMCSNYALYVAHRSSLLGNYTNTLDNMLLTVSITLMNVFVPEPTRNEGHCSISPASLHYFSKIRVRLAEQADIPQLATLLYNLDARETLWTVEQCTSQKQQAAYVFVSDWAVVGLAIIEPLENINPIRLKFSLDQYHYARYHRNYSALKAALLSPAFEPHSRFYTRELMRLAGSSALYWHTAYRNKWVAHKANALAAAMVPVMPSRSVLNFEDHQSLRNVVKNGMPFSTWFISSKLSSLPKVNVNARIVIVGASRTAMSFINTLLFGDWCTYATLSNVTLVSPGGLPCARRAGAAAELMFPQQRTASDWFLKSTPYTYYLNVVNGSLAEIDRQEQFVKLENGKKIFYDHLFIMFGKQYQHPHYVDSFKNVEDCINITSETYTRLDVPRPLESGPQMVDYETPVNVFIINTMADASRALGYMRSLLRCQNKFNVVVYGSTIEAYCCLTALLELKIPPGNIVFVEPFPPEDLMETRVSLFCNIHVDKIVKDSLDSLDVTVHRSYYFRQWSCQGDTITRVEFLSHFQTLRLECDAFFYYGKKNVNPLAFYAVNKCGLAYDGGILIDHECRTRDSAIYAAGPASRYRRLYHAESKLHQYCDSEDVGAVLGARIRNQLDPLFTETERAPCKATSKCVSFDSKAKGSDSTNTEDIKSTSPSKQFPALEPELRVPDPTKPLVWRCVLPGNLHYLEVRSPGMKIPHHFVHSLGYNGFVMETFKSGYFKLHMTKGLVVDGVTCITRAPDCLEGLERLYGLSAVTLNNVHLRYSSKSLDDLYKFFRAPWAAFLYHERVDELLAVAKELVPTTAEHANRKTLEEALRSIVRNINSTQTENQETRKEKLRSNFDKSAHFATITGYVIEWLSENDAQLPMYLQPWQVSEYTRHVPRHPAFRKRKLSICNFFSMIS